MRHFQPFDFPFVQIALIGWGSPCLNFATYPWTLLLLKFKIISFFFFIETSKVLSQWLMDQVPLGNKAPRPGYASQIWCPACRGLLENPMALTSGHVLLECMVVEGTCIEETMHMAPILYYLSRYTHS